MAADGPIHFCVADASHDPAIRALLRESSMGGDIQLSSRREPDYFRSVGAAHAESHTIVAMLDDRAVCVGSVGIRKRYINGEPRRIAYLGQLRLAESHQGRFDILRRGFRLFRTLLSRLDVAACFTSIAVDNMRARQLLESGVRGLPTYRPIGELITLAIPVASLHAVETKTSVALRPMTGSDIEAFQTFLSRSSERYQLAPCWSIEQMRVLVEGSHSFGVLAMRDGLAACGALLWDQRRFKQTVVTGYSGRLRLLRPMVNLIAGFMRRGRLPKEGTELAAAFVSHLSTTTDSDCLSLLTAMSQNAKSIGVDYLLIGFDQRDPRLHRVCGCVHARRYRTILYQLDWSAENLPFVAMDDRLLYPEIALL